MLSKRAVTSPRHLPNPVPSVPSLPGDSASACTPPTPCPALPLLAHHQPVLGVCFQPERPLLPGRAWGLARGAQSWWEVGGWGLL